MNSTEITYSRGDMVCRPTDWVDIVKFFLLNYALHGLTVVSEPGANWRVNLRHAIFSILMPSIGALLALGTIVSFLEDKRSELGDALRARALCTLVPSSPSIPLEDALQQVDPGVIIHGQYPIDATRVDQKSHRLSTDPEENSTQHKGYQLVVVPDWFMIEPLLKPHPKTVPKQGRMTVIKKAIKKFMKGIRETFTRRGSNEITYSKTDRVTTPHITCNYSIIKSLAALLQIIYASFELYRASGHQFDKYGYAAYSLTVIPYVFMSIVNLLANLSGPQYPSMYIVYYRGFDPRPTIDTTVEPKMYPSPMTSPGYYERVPQQADGSTAPHYQGYPMEGIDDERDAETTARLRGMQSESLRDRSGRKETRDSYPEGWWTEVERHKAEGMVTGAAGEVWGDFLNERPREGNSQWIAMALWLFLINFIMAGPYIMIQLLTGFKKGQSTQSQRSWVMCWIVFGQIFPVLMFLSPLTKWTESYMTRIMSESRHMWVFVTVFSVSSVGGFIVVAQMIAQDKVCFRI